MVFSSSKRVMELDIYAPSLSLAFEFHGEQHYGGGHMLFGEIDMTALDREKEEQCKALGITLIPIPFWYFLPFSHFICYHQCLSLPSFLPSFFPSVLILSRSSSLHYFLPLFQPSFHSGGTMKLLLWPTLFTKCALTWSLLPLLAIRSLPPCLKMWIKSALWKPQGARAENWRKKGAQRETERTQRNEDKNFWIGL